MVHRSRPRWMSYGLAGASLALALLLPLVLEPLQDKRPYLLFFPAIMVCAWQGGWGWRRQRSRSVPSSSICGCWRRCPCGPSP
jgi:hypothetical protein